MKEWICVEAPNEVEGGMLVRGRELIRCKDCDWFDRQESWCEFHAFEVPHEEKGFCYWAVEKCRKLPTVNPEMVEAFKKRQKGNR